MLNHRSAPTPWRRTPSPWTPLALTTGTRIKVTTPGGWPEHMVTDGHLGRVVETPKLDDSYVLVVLDGLDGEFLLTPTEVERVPVNPNA